jgi:hypothetical protein
MTEAEFRRLAAAYGGDLGRWPAPSQAEAAGLIRRAPHLAAVLEAEWAFDSRLQGQAPKVTAERMDAAIAHMMEQAMRPPFPLPSGGGDRPSPRWGQVSLALFACALLGFVLGLRSPAHNRAVAKARDVIGVLIDGETATFF